VHWQADFPLHWLAGDLCHAQCRWAPGEDKTSGFWMQASGSMLALHGVPLVVEVACDLKVPDTVGQGLKGFSGAQVELK